MIFFLTHQQNCHINFSAAAGCFNTLLKTNKTLFSVIELCICFNNNKTK